MFFLCCVLTCESINKYIYYNYEHFSAGGVSAWRRVRLEACPPGGLSAWRHVRLEALSWRAVLLEAFSWRDVRQEAPVKFTNWRNVLLEKCPPWRRVLPEACPPGGVSSWRPVLLEACPPGEVSALEACPPGGVSAWRRARLEACPPGGMSYWRLVRWRDDCTGRPSWNMMPRRRSRSLRARSNRRSWPLRRSVFKWRTLNWKGSSL